MPWLVDRLGEARVLKVGIVDAENWPARKSDALGALISANLQDHVRRPWPPQLR